VYISFVFSFVVKEDARNKGYNFLSACCVFVRSSFFLRKRRKGKREKKGTLKILAVQKKGTYEDKKGRKIDVEEDNNKEKEWTSK